MKKSKILDFDPEALLDPAPSSSDENEASASESEDQGHAGREHYADIGSSRLRKKEVVPLGPQYTGSRISRHAAEDEDSDDPFARGFDEVDSEEDDAVHGNGVFSGGESDEEEDDGLDESDAGSDDEMDDQDDDDDDDDDDSDGDQESSNTSEDDTAAQTSQLREMMKDQTSLATLSQLAKSDVEKGQAIKAQRKTFDSLLNTRIRLQKALISTNSLAADPHSQATPPSASIEAAEAAALTLLNTLTHLRSTLDSARTGEKRKRPSFTRTTPASEILSAIQTAESTALRTRTAVLEKWSLKTRSASLSTSKPRLSTTTPQTLTQVLTSHLQDPARLLQKTQIPRSCAPLQQQSAANSIPSPHIYDDADFYGLLLQELLERRAADLNAGGASEFVVQRPWEVARAAKTRKVVDTKASKGRKLRYTVHEKLQNFMAAEERGTWGERQRDELFGSLFGRRGGLGEEEEDGDVDVEEEGLMLFRG